MFLAKQSHALVFMILIPFEEEWWTGRDLNPRPFGHSRSTWIYANRTFFSPRLDSSWYTRLNYRPSRIAPRPIEVLRLWRNKRGWTVGKILIRVLVPLAKFVGPVAQHG